MTRADAERSVAKRLRGILLPDVVLPFDDEEFAGCTVADVLADPGRFEGATLADPLEGVAYGRCKAKIFRRADGTLLINSFAHGRSIYDLKHDAAAVREAVEAADNDKVVETLRECAANADIDDVVLHEMIDLAAKRSGVGKTPIKKVLKLDRSERNKERARAARTLQWRERRANGAPAPCLHNARLAIAALGVACSYDTFHNKLLFGYHGDKVRHEIASMLGEVSDNGIIRLRQIISERFGIDMGDKVTRDAVISLALEHCFDPVCDMLSEAEAGWDGIARLDTWVTDYLKCEDTPLNRAIGRKVLIAAVRRARHPGCKFDSIIVLESDEGYNKSTAWRVLAGDENFSDASILGHGAREVQEQLAEAWIHENADLAGMRKAEVESVKVFASRQSDDARPAYGHFLKKQKRHSIEVGTTNNDEYLQSQTGNRRFWPLVVREAIDIEPLKRDRMQLWGEAATHEALGESITLDEELWSAAGTEQEKRRVKDPWEETLSNIPETVEIDQYRTEQIIHRIDDQERVASADLLTYLLRVPIGQQEPRHAMRLATAMGLVGWRRTSNGKVTIAGKQVRGYFRFCSSTVVPEVEPASPKPRKPKPWDHRQK